MNICVNFIRLIRINQKIFIKHISFAIRCNAADNIVFTKTNNCNMKKLALVAMTLLMTLAATAKDIKTLVVTTQPMMHCENCENKIKDNIRFEKGIKKIETSIENQTVTITYDADKNSAENIMKAFSKIGYEATPAKQCQKAGGCQKAEGDCCKKQ